MKSQSVYEKRPWVDFYPHGYSYEMQFPDTSINDLFDEATVKWKNRIAIIFYGKQITYQELRDRVDRFAAALFGLGVRKGDRIGFLMLNSPEYIVSFYGVLKAGGIITPISPVYSSKECKYQLEDSGATMVICHDILYENLLKTGIKLKSVITTGITDSLPFFKKRLGKRIIRAEYQKVMTEEGHSAIKASNSYRFQDLIKRYPPHPPEIVVNPKNDIVCLPYTGGTTGAPKGVLITHHNIVANTMQFQAMYDILKEGEETIVSYMPFYHAGGQSTSVIISVLQGRTQVIITTPDMDEILRSIIRYDATCFFGVPSIYETLKDYEKTDRVKWKKLKLILSGADILYEDTSNDWKARTGTEIHDGYGQTEVVALSHISPLGKGKRGSIGIPVPGIMSAIVDPEKDKFLPLGEIGEIVVKGASVTRGYWNKPESTRECEAIIDNERWWRTGDLGRMDEDGYFYIYDRKRDLIKYKGLRIYAREVEEVLKEHPKIREAGVIGVPDIKVGQKVKAVVVLESDARGKLSEVDIIEYCKKELAPYKAPKIVEFVGEIPKTDVGKVSRREIREGDV